MNVSVLGCGRWGSFLAWYARELNHKVTLWGRANSRSLKELKSSRKNDYLTLHEDVSLSEDLKETTESADFVIIAIKSQELRSLAQELSKCSLHSQIFVLCMKGIEASTGKRLTQVFNEEIGRSLNVAVWVGPGHVQNYLNNIPNCMVVGSTNISVTKEVVNQFGSEIIRFYYGQDLIGNEIGAASKNVIGIAAGMLDGLNYSSLKGALMARGAREISRLVRAMGGNELTIYGLSHLGDYEATLFSPHSNNRKFGEDFIEGKVFNKLAEGISTASALKLLSSRHDVDLPICNSIYSIINENRAPKEILLDLFFRPVKYEF